MFFLALVYDFYKVKEARHFFYWLAAFVLIIVSGVRYHVGLDSIRLAEWYDECPDLLGLNLDYIDDYRHRYQPLWLVFSASCKLIVKDFFFLQLMQSLMVNSLIFYYIKKTTSFAFSSVLIYYLLAYVLFNFEIMRESMAVAMAIVAYLNFERRRWFIYLLFGAIAFYLHVSGLMVLFYPLIARVKMKSHTIIFAYSLVIFVNIIYAQYIDLMFALLSSNTDTISGHILTYARAGNIGNTWKYYVSIYFNGMLLPLSSLYLYRRFSGYNYKYGSMVLVFSVFSLLGNQSVAFLRFSNYLIIFYIILSGSLLQLFLRRISPRIPYALAFCFLISFTFLYSLSKPVPRLDGVYTYSRYYPYRTIILIRLDADRELWSRKEFN